MCSFCWCFSSSCLGDTSSVLRILVDTVVYRNWKQQMKQGFLGLMGGCESPPPQLNTTLNNIVSFHFHWHPTWFDPSWSELILLARFWEVLCQIYYHFTCLRWAAAPWSMDQDMCLISLWLLWMSPCLLQTCCWITFYPPWVLCSETQDRCICVSAIRTIRHWMHFYKPAVFASTICLCIHGSEPSVLGRSGLTLSSYLSNHSQ